MNFLTLFQLKVSLIFQHAWIHETESNYTRFPSKLHFFELLMSPKTFAIPLEKLSINKKIQCECTFDSYLFFRIVWATSTDGFSIFHVQTLALMWNFWNWTYFFPSNKNRTRETKKYWYILSRDLEWYMYWRSKHKNAVGLIL